MKKSLILSVVLALMLASMVSAQTMKAIPENGKIWTRDYGTGATVVGPGDAAHDSGDFEHTYFFDLPPEMKTDTLQLLIWSHSGAGAVDLDLSVTYAVRIGKKVGKGMSDTTNFKLSGTETVLKTAHATESLVGYEIVPSADDTMMNGTLGRFISPTALLIEVDSGGDTNQSDTKYWIGVVGKKGVMTTSN